MCFGDNLYHERTAKYQLNTIVLQVRVQAVLAVGAKVVLSNLIVSANPKPFPTAGRSQ